MKRILKNQKVRGLSIISILFLFWCCPLDFCQCPAFGEGVKESTKLSPQGEGSAWDLPAGVYGEDGQSEDSDPPDSPGGSPQPGQGSSGYGGSPHPGGGSSGFGGSPRPGGGSSGFGGSPQPGGGGSTGPGGSPQPAD